MSEALSTTLDDLARGMRVHIASNQPPNLDTCAGLFAALQAAAHAARALEARLEEMETIARDCDLIAHAKAGEVGPVRPRLVEEPAREPVTRARAGSPDNATVDRLAADIMALDNTVGDETPGNLVDLREALIREHREAQASIEANEQRLEQLRARENECGNDFLIVLPYRSRRRPLTYCGGPQDGGAA